MWYACPKCPPGTHWIGRMAFVGPPAPAAWDDERFILAA